MENHKNIAIVVAGIDEEYQTAVIEGAIRCTREQDANLSIFSAFGGVMGSPKYDMGEYNIYRLANFKKFDGVILMTNTICDPDMKQFIIQAVKEAGTPAVFLDCDDDPAFYNIRIDNNNAMRSIIRHVIQEHGAKTLNFISGPLSNPEAQARYEAFLEVLAENRLIGDVRRIYFGEFRPQDGEDAVETFLKSGISMPDAIVCANDAMALAAMRTLEKHGYSIPDDVIVTGFDDTYNARHYSPALTTVTRPLHEMGYQAAELLLRISEGGSSELTLSLDAEPIFTESCGCPARANSDLQSYKKSVSDLLDSTRSDISLLNRLTSRLAESDTIEENLNAISGFFEKLECTQFSICLCAEWDSVYIGRSQNDFQIKGYTPTMSAPLIWTNGEVSAVDQFASAKMNPKPLPGGKHVFYYLPLHFRERCLGYYVITDCDFPIKSMVCHSLLMNISNSLENVRKLLHLNSVIAELDKLYVIDPLCGIYNRNGFIREADTLYRHCLENGENLMISFIDMDGLKLVNDSYGHKEGDFALQRLAAVISDCCGKNQICARFGGDEFILLGADCTQEDADALERLFRKKLDDINVILHKPYQLDASIGTYVSPVTESVPLFNMITTADAMMYEKKKKKKTSRYLRKA